MDELENESGGSLRQKLEEALAAKAALESNVVALTAEKVIGASGFKYVTPSDLAGVPLTDLEVKAQEIEQQKAAQADALLRTAVKARGVPDDQIDQVIAGLVGTNTPAVQAVTTFDRLNAIGQIQGGAPGTIPDQVKPGYDRIAAGIAAGIKK